MSISDAFLGGEQKRNESHLENLVEVALSDGKIVDEERALLEKFAKRLSISKEDLNEIILNIGKHPINPPTGKEDRYKRFFRLIQMMLADGIIGEKQDRLIHKFAIGLGYSEERTEEIYDQTIQFVKDKVDFDDAFEKLIH
ncbi:TerB family tellurite resistance protein [Flavobacteriales bacterium]|jgi:uncharacterized tellurite resistance protein B-like protein|nr:TerB family tellurite resistance protein [Flavobacteriales bacterium]